MIRRANGVRALVLVVVLGASACSSAPKQQTEFFDQRNLASQYNDFGTQALEEGDTDRAIRFFTVALAYNGSVDNRPGIAESHNALGKAHAAAGAFAEAARHFELARAVAADAGEIAIAARARNNMGEARFSLGEFETALELFETALTDGAGELPDADRAVILHNLGSASRRLGRPDQAASYFQEALKINSREELWKEAAANHYMLASLETEASNYVIAADHARMALEADKRVENSVGIAKDYEALGSIARRTGELEGALEFLERAVFVYRSLEVARPGLDVEADLLQAIELVIEVAEQLGNRELVDRYRELVPGRPGS